MSNKPTPEEVRRADECLDDGPMGGPWVDVRGPDETVLDGTFTREQVEAVLVLMRYQDR